MKTQIIYGKMSISLGLSIIFFCCLFVAGSSVASPNFDWDLFIPAIASRAPTCEDLNPTQEQIDSAVAKAIIGIDNPWGNVSDFQLLLDRIPKQLHCTLQSPNNAALPQIKQNILPQQSGTCAVPGVDYCGPGNSLHGTTLHTDSTCLNEACCRHDTCYAANCIDTTCYWSAQTGQCDAQLSAVCDGGCTLDIRGKIICAIVHAIDGTNPTCPNSPTCPCAGETCENFTTCNPGSGCSEPVCGSLAEGGGVCLEGATPCSGLADCTTSTDCNGGLCLVGSCCGRPVCVPSSAFCPDIGVNQAVQGLKVQSNVEGLTIGGPPR
jgi:hypothetical protein